MPPGTLKRASKATLAGHSKFASFVATSVRREPIGPALQIHGEELAEKQRLQRLFDEFEEPAAALQAREGRGLSMGSQGLAQGLAQGLTLPIHLTSFSGSLSMAGRRN